MKKIIPLSILLILTIVGAVQVFAVTLTRESTERVVVLKAIRASLVGSSDEIVFGFADVYGKGNLTGAPDAAITIFVYQDKLYRGDSNPRYERINCRKKTFTDPPEKGGRSYDAEVCDEGRILGQEGIARILYPDGRESESIFDYFIGFDSDGKVGDLELIIRDNPNYRGIGTTVRSEKILKTAENIEWTPQ